MIRFFEILIPRDFVVSQLQIFRFLYILRRFYISDKTWLHNPTKPLEKVSKRVFSTQTRAVTVCVVWTCLFQGKKLNFPRFKVMKNIWMTIFGWIISIILIFEVSKQLKQHLFLLLSKKKHISVVLWYKSSVQV